MTSQIGIYAPSRLEHALLFGLKRPRRTAGARQGTDDGKWCRSQSIRPSMVEGRASSGVPRLGACGWGPSALDRTSAVYKRGADMGEGGVDQQALGGEEPRMARLQDEPFART